MTGLQGVLDLGGAPPCFEKGDGGGPAHRGAVFLVKRIQLFH